MVERDHLGCSSGIERDATRWHVIDRVIKGAFVVCPDDLRYECWFIGRCDLDGLLQFFGLDRIMQSGKGEFVEFVSC